MQPLYDEKIRNKPFIVDINKLFKDKTTSPTLPQLDK